MGSVIDYNSGMMNIRPVARMGLISPMKTLFILIALELLTMWFFLFTEPVSIIYYVAIMLVPVFIILIPVEPTIGLAAMVITTGMDYFGSVSSGPSNYGTFTYFHLAMILTFISTGLNIMARRKFTLPSLSIFPPLICFLLMYVISFTRTPSSAAADALFTIARILMLSTLIFVAVTVIDTRQKLYALIGVIILTTVVLSSMTLYQMFNEGTFFAPIVIKMANTIGLPVFRASATFMNPNSLACFLMVGAAIAFAAMFIKENPFYLKVIIFLSVLVINLGLIASFSRGGWVSTFFAFSLIVIFHRKWSYFWYLGLFLFFCLIIISIKVPRLWEVVFERFGSIFNAQEDASSSGRLALIKTGIWMWMDHPIFGVGLRAFPALYDQYLDPSMPQVLSHVHEAHTIQAEILAEFGLIGLSVASWLCFTVVFEGIRTINRMQSNVLRCLQIGFVSLFAGYIMNFTFATDITNNIFWLTVGLIYTVPQLDNQTSPGLSFANGNLVSATPGEQET